MYYTVIKHSSHLRTLEKCRKHSPAARAFCISLVFSNASRVLSECNTRLRLLYLLNKTIFKCEDVKFFAQKLPSVCIAKFFYKDMTTPQPKYNFLWCIPPIPKSSHIKYSYKITVHKFSQSLQ